MHWALQKQKGFTIVELLIVVVVIAILAAITIVAYSGITNRSKQAAVATMAAQVQKKLAVYAATNGDRYPDTLAQADVNGALASKVQYSVNNLVSPAGFCVTASQDGLSSYVASNYQYTTTAPQTANQSTPTAGVCPGHSSNDSPVITNLFLNPVAETAATGWSAVASTGGAQSGARFTSVSGLTPLGVTTDYRNTLGGAAASWWRVQYNAGVPVTEGKSYVLSGYIRPSVAATTGVIILWANAAGEWFIETPGTFAAQTAMSWAQKSVVATAPAGAVSMRAHFGATNGGAAGAYIDATAVMFYEGTIVYPYNDGDSAGWIWEGAANASRSKGPAQ